MRLRTAPLEQAYGCIPAIGRPSLVCRRSVANKAAAGMPAFVRLKDEGVLDDLDSQRQAAEQYRSLIVDAALRAS